MSRFISNTDFYNRLLRIKEKEVLLKEREVEALESISESLKAKTEKE